MLNTNIVLFSGVDSFIAVGIEWQNMPRFNGITVRVYAPSDKDSAVDERDERAVLDALESHDQAEVPLVEDEDGYLERFEVSGGHLELGAWTGEENGDGWYVHIKIPLLPTDGLHSFLNDLSETLSKFSDRFSVKDVRTKEVDSSGRVSVGKERAGEKVRVAVLED